MLLNNVFHTDYLKSVPGRKEREMITSCFVHLCVCLTHYHKCTTLSVLKKGTDLKF